MAGGAATRCSRLAVTPVRSMPGRCADCLLLLRAARVCDLEWTGLDGLGSDWRRGWQLQPEGNRNLALYWAACRQAEAGVPEDEARHVLGAAAARTGLGEREIEATLTSAFRTLGRRPAQTAEVSYRLAP